MTSVAEEIDGYRKELREAVGRSTDDDIHSGLLALANKVGALTHTTRSGGFIKEQNEDLVQNISLTLQTWAMIDACRTAARNHEVALAAMKNSAESQAISKRTMIAAWVAASAAWAAVIVQLASN